MFDIIHETKECDTSDTQDQCGLGVMNMVKTVVKYDDKLIIIMQREVN